MGSQANRRPAPRVEPGPAALEVVHDNVTYRVAVKRVGSARRFTLRVRAATREAVLTMPSRASLRTARSFAERHADWIVTRLRSLPGPIPIAPGAVLPVRGVDHVVVLYPVHDGGRAKAEICDVGPCDRAELRVFGDPASTGGLIENLLRREALHDLRLAVQRHCQTVEKDCSRIVVRDTRSRWGSCSARGTLSFSWRLILAPPFVLDYLAAHEVAHLCHLNHSPAFWAVVERLAPQTDAAEAWLKRHGSSLHLYAVA